MFTAYSLAISSLANNQAASRHGSGQANVIRCSGNLSYPALLLEQVLIFRSFIGRSNATRASRKSITDSAGEENYILIGLYPRVFVYVEKELYLTRIKYIFLLCCICLYIFNHTHGY